MENRPADFQVFVKPVGARCNLHCAYCYYKGTGETHSDERMIMSDAILEKCIIQQFEASKGNSVLFSWHGGEPLLAGIDFYRKALDLQKKHCPEGVTFFNGIQTNGILINQQWCEFFRAGGFNIGISIDGSRQFHDSFRHSYSGSSSFEGVMNGFALLKKNGILPEILCVVNSINSQHPIQVYDFFKSIGASFITFLALVEHDETAASGVSDRSVKPADFGAFLSEIFDEWVEKDIGSIKIQIFEEAIRTAFSQDHTLCIFRENCGRIPVVEHNGNFYSCDHYVNSGYMIGNIGDTTISSMLDCERQVSFGTLKSSLPEYCKACSVKPMCNGECPKNRFMLTPEGEPGLNYLCEGYREFFNHCRPFVDAVKQMWK